MSAKVFDSIHNKDVKHIKPAKANQPEDDYKWWFKDELEIGNAIGQVVSRIEAQNSQRRTSFVRFAHMYGNYEALGWQNLQFQTNQNSSNNKIRLNLIQSIIDSCSSKIAKDQPKPFFTTKGGDFYEKIAAQKATDLVAGIMQANGFAEKSNDVFRDGGIYGTGAVHWFIEEGEVKCEWVFVDELKVDEYDGMMKQPRQLHRVKLINKEILAAKYPDKAKELDDYLMITAGNRFKKKQSVVEMVRVRYSWHLPSSANADDGVFAITCGDICLEKIPYNKNHYPITIWRWYDKPLGFYGRSITEEIYSVQFEVNKLLQTAQQAYELIGVPVIFVESASDVSEDDILQNFIGRMINYTGVKPTFESPEPLPAGFMPFLMQYIQWAFQIVGLSQSAATGTKPAGVESGQAIREVVDIETSRFAQVGRSWEQYFCENGFVVLDLVKDLQKMLGDKDVVVSKVYKKQIKDINFRDIEDIVNNLHIRCDPVSSLPDTPQGRIQTITEYIQNRWISEERGMDLLNLDPDLDREVEMKTASLRLVDKMLTQMAEDGEPQHPNKYLNVPQALEVSLQVLNLLTLQGCPDDRLQLIRDFIDELYLLQQSQQPQQPQAPQPIPQNVPAQAGALPSGMPNGPDLTSTQGQ
jgi:hypothetical protein